MPDYNVEVHSRSTYGPFTYADPGKLRQDLVSGELNLREMVVEEDLPTRFVIKELKEPKGGPGLF